MRALNIRRGYADSEFGQLHYRATGHSGTPVVLLHQTASSSRMFAAFQQELPKTQRTLAWDTPGFGLSDPLPHTPTVAAYAESLRAATLTLGHSDVHLIGHHTGAAIATYWAATWPQEVRSLTMIGSLAMGNGARARWLTGITETQLTVSGAHLVDAWHRVGHIDQSPTTHVPSPSLRHRETTDALLATPGWEAAYRAVFSFDFEDTASRVTCPTQLICGDQDILAPYTDATASLLRNVVVHQPAGGAYLTDEQPDMLAGLVTKFLHGLIETSTTQHTPAHPSHA